MKTGHRVWQTYLDHAEYPTVSVCRKVLSRYHRRHRPELPPRADSQSEALLTRTF
jgi:hypothetical protein